MSPLPSLISSTARRTDLLPLALERQAQDGIAGEVQVLVADKQVAADARVEAVRLEQNAVVQHALVVPALHDGEQRRAAPETDRITRGDSFRLVSLLISPVRPGLE